MLVSGILVSKIGRSYRALHEWLNPSKIGSGARAHLFIPPERNKLTVLVETGTSGGPCTIAACSQTADVQSIEFIF